VVADANAVLGFYYLHGNYYSVNPNGGGTVVTTSPNGNMTDILVLAPQGALPLFMPLAQVGVPQPILVALDPAVRAIIETGYARSSDPSQQVMFALLPPVSAWPGDVTSVVSGVVTTVTLLPGAVIASVPGAPGVPGVLVLTPLKTTSPLSSLSPVNTSPVNLSAQQVQANTITNPATNPETNAAQQIEPTPPSTQSVSSPSGLNPKETTTPTKPSTPNIMVTGNRVTPPSTNAGGSTSSSSNPLTGALAGVTNAIGSLTSGVSKSISTGSTSSGSQSTGGP